VLAIGLAIAGHIFMAWLYIVEQGICPGRDAPLAERAPHLSKGVETKAGKIGQIVELQWRIGHYWRGDWWPARNPEAVAPLVK